MDLTGTRSTDPYGDRGVPAAGPVSGRSAPALVGSADLDPIGAYGEYETAVPGTLVPPADLAALTGQTAYVPVEAASPYAPEVLVPARVLPGRREQQTARLGATTDRLLLHHVREGRPTTTDIPGREWRSLPGMQARALAPRGR